MATFEQLENDEIKLPDKIRCINCGQLAQQVDDMSELGDLVCPVYLCDCGWFTDWEITNDGEGNIHTSTLFYRDEEDNNYQWYELRDRPHFWIPDGLDVPAEALTAVGQ